MICFIILELEICVTKISESLIKISWIIRGIKLENITDLECEVTDSSGTPIKPRINEDAAELRVTPGEIYNIKVELKYSKDEKLQIAIASSEFNCGKRGFDSFLTMAFVMVKPDIHTAVGDFSNNKLLM